MNSIKGLRASPLTALLAAAGVFLTGASLTAQDVQHLSVTVPGGVPGLPTITGIEHGSNTVTVTWYGPSGYYQLFEKPAMTSPRWLEVAGPTLALRATVPADSNAVFRIYGPQAAYAGADVCTECHTGIHASQKTTLHAAAFYTLKTVHQETNPSCLPCHTVGYGKPTGFVSQTATPQLAGVQCENCHGPAANHAANPDDFALRPRVELAATMCGGCHTWAPKPTYQEWAASEHAQVTEPDMDPNTCGRCHIGTARVAMLEHTQPPQNDRNVGVTCAVCHLSHSKSVFTNVLNGVFTFTNQLTGNDVTFANHQLGPIYTNQLRNPVASTKDYYLTTTDIFTNKYDPTINICGQCHNHRGATYTSSSRPPHPSLQYNMLIGTVGVLPNTTSPHFPSTHSHIEQQCVSCHMQSAPGDITGHKFVVASYDVCAQCHKSAANAQALATFVQSAITNQVQSVKAALDLWATTKAPELLRSKYGARAWEYTHPGALSPGGPGPNSDEQSLIPETIQKARFNLYLVNNDGSFGVHNGPYAVDLLDAALDWVEQALDQ